MTTYEFGQIEEKWRPYWDSIDLYHSDVSDTKPKRYILDFFPYPSGSGLSVGHAKNYVPTCVYSRFSRMNGYNVLHPMGWDAFGLPAENYAIEHGIHPRQTTNEQAHTYRRQMQLMACSYDWSKEIDSTDPDYYRWTQWFFLLLHKRGLAYRAMGSQWWCPTCQTILANEQVEDGRCWRCDDLVTKKDLPQWYFKITAYADRLIDGLDTISWPEPIKRMQRNWIGRSEGAEIRFGTEVGDITVFTTRPDTLPGVTFITLAPEHTLTLTLTTDEQKAAVTSYITQAKRQSEIERLSTSPAKTGVFTGAYATHPISGEPVPIWVADYVLTSYGTGAVMGVPAHDARDFAFAQQYSLPIIEVVSADGHPAEPFACFTEKGIALNAGAYNGLTSAKAGQQMVADLAERGRAHQTVTYKVRDWLISRQRYWGAPIPIVHCPACGEVAVPEADLPVRLPEDVLDFAPAGDAKSPLARLESWVNTPCPACGDPAKRETDTMDGFACSSWYFLRFPNPHYHDGPFDPAGVCYWLPVDTYVGGAEHAVMHLLYARFWTKVMYDAGIVSFTEPFAELKNQGVMHAPDGQRMSKSRGNVIRPDTVIAEHGTDALRTFIVFMGPFDGNVYWTDTGIKGVNRFLSRFWQLANHTPPAGQALPSDFRYHHHHTIKRVTGDMASFKFNTAVAAMMEWVNYLFEVRDEGVPAGAWRSAIETISFLLAPIAPFITEEVWQTVLGNAGSVHRQAWPEYDESALVTEEVTIVVQVNGKVRGMVVVPAGATPDTIQQLALAQPKVQRYTIGKTIRRIIPVPNKLINIVVS